MCNAWNHPASCTCGFGGEGHAGRTTARLDSYSFRGVPCILPAYDSYVNPNAKCPVCHAAVFFYQSQDGGRVFFDELGPPWPKHPCTDRGSAPASLDPSSIAPIKKVPTWKRQGWIPYFMTGGIDRDRQVYEVRGTFVDSSITIYVRKKANPFLTSLNDFTPDTIAFLKHAGDESYELSLISHLGIPATVKAFSRISRVYDENRTAAPRTRPQTTKSDGVCTGTVKWFDSVRGYGFISLDHEAEDVFLHASALKRSHISDIYEGQRVCAIVRTGRKGKEALTIEVL